MYNLKKISIVGFVALLVHFTSTAKNTVVTTTTILYDITKNIAGDRITVKCLMPVGGDPHIYEPTPADAQKIANAQLIIKNGLHLEGWLNKIITAANSSATVIEAAKGIEPIKSESMHGSPDPHAWMDPNLGIIFALNIEQALEALDYENKVYYQQNLQNYIVKLKALDIYIKTKVALIPQNARVLVTTHDAFKYFGRTYGIKVESVMGTSTDADVQIADMNHLIKTIRDRHIPAVFVESTINPKLLTQIAQDNGIAVGGSLYADSIGDENGPAGTYITMLTYNIDVISNALTGGILAEKTNDTNQFYVLISTVSIILLIAFLILYKYVKNNKLVALDWNTFTIDINDVST
jgi:ABC-type Zn uptake system ZnuABC Zn-binding protein ZnuA